MAVHVEHGNKWLCVCTVKSQTAYQWQLYSCCKFMWIVLSIETHATKLKPRFHCTSNCFQHVQKTF